MLNLGDLELALVFGVLIVVVKEVLRFSLFHLVALCLQLLVVLPIGLVHGLLVVSLLLGHLALQLLDLLLKAANLTGLRLVLLGVIGSVDLDLLACLDDVSLKIVPLGNRSLNDVLAVVDILADITIDINLLVQGEKSCLHSFHLNISFAENELEVLVFDLE